MTTKTLIEKSARALAVLQAMEQQNGALWEVRETPQELDALCAELRAAIDAAGQQDEASDSAVVRTLKPADVLVETWSSQRTSGFVVRPQTGIRLTHVPTRMVVQCDSERSQHANRDKAWRELEQRLTTWSDDEIRASATALPRNRVTMASPSMDAAHRMGAEGGPAVEAERLAFEAWMAGHCWLVSGTWDGKTYVSRAENGSFVDPGTMATRQLWAAWRDQAALAKI